MLKGRHQKARPDPESDPVNSFPTQYEEIAEKIDQQAIADQLTQLEPEILAKY